MKTEDYLELPDFISINKFVDLPKKALDVYKQFEKEFIMTITDSEIAVFNAAALAGKLLQFANGCVYDEDKNEKDIHTGKLDALEDIIEAANGEPVLVAYNFKSDLRRILDRFPSAKVMDKAGAILDDWNAGKVEILLAHPASAGHGLNLQKGGNIMVWFGLNWSLELYQQFNARLYRQGQTKPVTCYHLIAKDTIDEKLMKAIDAKATTQDQLLEALKQ